jgi:hemerythrin-like domain-containing protein
MPVTIGAPPAPDFSKPIELLSDCHRRIERFLGALLQVTEQARGGEMTEIQQRDWQAALAYFRNAAPRHTADEEESLFPRLRARGAPEVAKALADLERLESDHERASYLHELVDMLGRRWVEQKRLDTSEIYQLLDALEQLRELYQGHIALEDESLFPIAAVLLSEQEKAEMGMEMARRRGVDVKKMMQLGPELGDGTPAF